MSGFLSSEALAKEVSRTLRIAQHDYRIDAAGGARRQIRRQHGDDQHRRGRICEHRSVGRLYIVEHRRQDAGQQPGAGGARCRRTLLAYTGSVESAERSSL